MNIPPDVTELIEELRGEVRDSSVVIVPDSKAVVYLDAEDANAGNGIEFSKTACELLFHNRANVERLLEALKNPDEPSIVLHNIEIHSEVLTALEECFIAVDEE